MKTNISNKPAKSKIKNSIKSVKRGAPKSKKAPKVVEGEKAISITEQTVVANSIEDAVKLAAKENIKNIEETKKIDNTVSETKADNIKSDTKSYDFESNTTYLDATYSNMVLPSKNNEDRNIIIIFGAVSLLVLVLTWLII